MGGTGKIGPYTHVEVVGNTIFNNTQAFDAGGITISGAESTLIQSNIISNNKGMIAGGIGTSNTQAVNIVQNVIYANTAQGGSFDDAGGIAISSPQYGSSIPPQALIVQNTLADNILQIGISGNSATDLNLAGAVSKYIVANNIFSGGSSSTPTINCSVIYASLAPTPIEFDHNDVFNSNGSAFGGACPNQTGNSGNISVDPQFASVVSHDYHLIGTSPGIDTGNNSGLAMAASGGASIATDLDGNARVQDATAKACATVDMGAYEYPGVVIPACDLVTETLVSSLNPSVFGAAVTFTAQVAFPGSVPTGSIQFADGATVLATQSLLPTGIAALTTSDLAVGTHPISAVYQPTGSFSPSLAGLSQVVTGYPTITTLTCSPSDIAFNGTALLSVLVASASGIPVGSVTLSDNGTILSALTLSSGTASSTYTGLAAGKHSLTATYPDGGAFAGSSASCTLTVAGAPTVLTLVSSATPRPPLRRSRLPLSLRGMVALSPAVL